MKRQHMGGWTTATANAKQNGLSATTSPERLRGTTHDLFELLERVQCSRLDDQRCVLPSYFTQPCIMQFVSIVTQGKAPPYALRPGVVQRRWRYIIIIIIMGKEKPKNENGQEEEAPMGDETVDFRTTGPA
uniref:Uncharacterized protein n=1 Tax=Anopheles farauti TaxID=69004 RepID=A0A182Q8N2_9DIPT